MRWCFPSGTSAITGTKDGLAWACGILQSTQWISLHRGRDCRICLGEVGDFSPLVTGSLVDRFHAVFVVGQIWAVWDKFGTWGYLRYPDSRISWCSCWRAMAILIILGWATQCIPRKSLANMSCEKMWILSPENGLVMTWRCHALDITGHGTWCDRLTNGPIALSLRILTWGLTSLDRLEKTILTGCFNLNVKCMLNVHLQVSIVYRCMIIWNYMYIVLHSYIVIADAFPEKA